MTNRELRGTPHIPPTLRADLLGLYLTDHLTGATAGVRRSKRMAADFADTPVAAELAALAVEIEEEHALYVELVERINTRRRRHRQITAWAGERAGRLKYNGRILTRSPMTMVLETELMRAAVMGKLGGFQTLADHAEQLGLDKEQFEELSEQARRQLTVLDRVHAHARERAFRHGRDIAA